MQIRHEIMCDILVGINKALKQWLVTRSNDTIKNTVSPLCLLYRILCYFFKKNAFEIVINDVNDVQAAF